MGRQIGNSFEGWEPALCPCQEKDYHDDKYDEEKQKLIQEERQVVIRQDHILLLTYGWVSAQNMLEGQRSKNYWTTWIFRVVGFCLMCGGLYSVFLPIIVLLKVIPFIATLASSGLFLVVFITSLVLTLIIVSVAWVFSRPFLVAGLVAIAVGIVVLVSELHK